MDIAAMNASLDNDYGTTRGPNAAASHQLALFTASPEAGGVEITGDGYGRATVAAAAWAAASGGIKATTNAVGFPTATGDWETARHLVVYAGSVAWDDSPLAEPLSVVTGTAPQVRPRLYYTKLALQEA